MVFKFFVIIFLFFLSFFFDYFSKSYFRNIESEKKTEIIKNFLDINISCNKGISFSFLKELNKNFLIFFIGIFLISLTFYVFFINFEYFSKKEEKRFNFLSICGFSMILGGAYGNFFDRIKNNCVLDFLDLHFKNYHFFIFNFADFFISIGFLFIILNEIMKIYKTK